MRVTMAVCVLALAGACNSGGGGGLKKGDLSSSNAAAQCEALRDLAQSAPDFGKYVAGLSIPTYWSKRSKLMAKCIKAPAMARECFKGKKSLKEAEPCARALLEGRILVEDGKKMSKSGMKYVKKSRTSEAREFVKKIYDGARTYYMDRGGTRGMQQLPPQFPGPSMPPTPPLGTCCKSGGKCAPSAALWTNPVWVALQFSVDDPHYYSYSYTVKGNTFTARANGDLDCDGVYSTFEMIGVINATYSDGPAGNASLYREKELE